MAELTRIVYAALLVAGLGIAFGLFFVDFSTKNLTAGTQNYTFIENSTTNALLMVGVLGDMRDAVDAIQVINSDPITSSFTILKGAFAFFKLPVAIVQYLAALIVDALTFIGVPASISTLIMSALIFMGLVGVVAAASGRISI